MIGTDMVKANAPITPSIENVASRISRYMILLISDKWCRFLSSSSTRAACSLKPWVMKKTLDPMEAAKAIMGSILSASRMITLKMTETTAKNHTPCLEKKRSTCKPNSLGSRNSQWKNKKIRKTPPPSKSGGADSSSACWICGSLLKLAVNAPHGPTDGLAIHTINHGKSPRTMKTPKKIPHIKNHLRHLTLMVDNTSALTTALSMLETTSNRQRPKMLKMMCPISIS